MTAGPGRADSADCAGCTAGFCSCIWADDACSGLDWGSGLLVIDLCSDAADVVASADMLTTDLEAACGVSTIWGQAKVQVA